jgi:hypothetical protein
MTYTQTQEKTASLLASLWLRNRPLIEERDPTQIRTLTNQLRHVLFPIHNG